KKGGTKKKPGKRKGAKAKTAKRKAKDRANKTEKVSGIALGKLDKKLIARLEKNGVKISKEDVIRIKELPDEKKLYGWKKGIHLLDLSIFLLNMVNNLLNKVFQNLSYQIF
ncbi:hypothetical protein, partial [Lactiplantibacillus plantarum]